MSQDSVFIIDADVLIAEKNSYYAFAICPGFWDSILRFHKAGRVFSISRVRHELVAGRKDEDLRLWVENQLPSDFFLDVDTENVMARYTEIMLWSQRHDRYQDASKAKFATGADGWLAAYAATHKVVVVTNEQPAPDGTREIKLPDVCATFNASICNTFQMLRSLNVGFILPST